MALAQVTDQDLLDQLNDEATTNAPAPKLPPFDPRYDAPPGAPKLAPFDPRYDAPPGPLHQAPFDPRYDAPNLVGREEKRGRAGDTSRVVPKLTPVVDPDLVAQLQAGGGTVVPKWNMADSTVNGLLLGQVPRANALAAGIKAKLSGGNFGSTYADTLAAQEKAHQDFAQAHPYQDTGGNVLGSFPTVMAAGGAVNAGIQAAKGAGYLAPSVGRALLGLSGQGVEGVTGGLAKVGSGALSGAREGAQASALTSGLGQGSTSDQTLGGAGVGAVLGAALPAPVAAGARMVGGNIDPGVAAVATKMKDLGIDAKLGQIVQGGKAGVQGTTDQLKQYTKAVSNLFGEDTDKVTSDTINRAWDRSQKVLDGVTTSVGEKASSPVDITAARQALLEQKHLQMVAPLVNDNHGLIDPQAFSKVAKGTYQDGNTGVYASHTPDNVKTLAEGGRYLPQPTDQGGVQKVAQGGVFNRLLHGGIGAGAGMGLGYLASEIGPEVASAIAHGAGSLPGAAAVGALGAGAYAGARYGIKKFRGSDVLRDMQLREALGQNSLGAGAMRGVIAPSATTYNQ